MSRTAVTVLSVLLLAAGAAVQAAGPTCWPQLGRPRPGQDPGLPDSASSGPGRHPPGRRHCAAATVVRGLPYSDAGDTVRYTNDYDSACTYTGSTSPTSSTPTPRPPTSRST